MDSEKYYAGFLNLAHRTDRLEHMTAQLKKAGIDAIRHAGKLPHEYNLNDPRLQTMYRRTPGAIGCHFGQVGIIQVAQLSGRHAVVFEDDCVFCEDFQKRMEHIERWMETNEWDIFWLGSSFHVGPAWWHRRGHRHGELEGCRCELGRDAETTSDPRIMRTYGAFATFAYIVNHKSIDQVLWYCDQFLHESMGIDWLMIRIQPQLKTYAFVPGCVRQMDNQSDIGNGITHWSGFLQLNGTRENSAYVYQERMEDFDPMAFDWKEAKQ